MKSLEKDSVSITKISFFFTFLMSSEASVNIEEQLYQEIINFEQEFPDCPYKIMEKIGQGTFSSVYKAIDIYHKKYYNAAWCLDHDKAKDYKYNSCGIVAIKRIYQTSSPKRILDELALLHCLG